MKKKLRVGILSIMTGSAMLFAGVSAQAGPKIDFGEDGYVQLDIRLQGFVEHTDFGSGNDGLGDRSDVNLRRGRLTFTGMIDDTYGIKFTTDTYVGSSRNMFGGGYVLSPINDANGSDIRVIDAYGVALYDAFNLKVGLSKIPFTRANLDDCYTNLTADRSTFVYSPFGTYRTHFSRNLGVVINGSVGTENFKYWGAIIEGREGKSKWTNPYNEVTYLTTPEPSSNFGYVGRVHYSFLDPEGGGYQGSYLGKKKVFTLGAGLSYESEVAFKNVTGGTTANTNPTVVGDETVDYFAYTLDAFFEHPFDFGTLTATALYLNADMDDAYKTITSPADLSTIVGGTNGQKDGYYLKFGYLLPITVGEKGKIQPYLFHENWDLAYLFGERDQNVKQYGGGVNYYIVGDNRVRLTAEYYDTQFDKTTRVGDYQTFVSNQRFDSYDSFRLMFQFVF